MPAVSKIFFLKNCEECGKEIICRINRDRKRKRFCSRKCLVFYLKKLGLFRGHGTKWTEERKIRQGLMFRGNNHPRWIEDRTKLKHRPKFENRKWELAVFERDNFTCQKCGYKGRELVIHHIKPYCLFPNLRFDMDNGQTLCRECHKQTDSYCVKLNKLLQIYVSSS